MVAKYADWWFLDYDKSAADLAGVEDSLRRAMDGMNARAAKYGRKVRFAFNPFVAFGETDEAALEHAKKLLTPDEPDADVRKMMQRVGPAMKSGCIGRPQKVRDQLLKYTDMGVELFLLKFVPTVDAVHEIRDELIEPLRGYTRRRLRRRSSYFFFAAFACSAR